MDEVVLADGERAPGYWARYRFYTAGKVPRGHEEWARRRLSLRRFLAVYYLIDLVAWLLVALAVVVVTGGFSNPSGLWVAAALFALVTPFSAAHYRNKARRALAPPPSAEVLRQIGEAGYRRR